MEILKIVKKLDSFSEEYVGLRIDEGFAEAVHAAAELLVKQGEQIVDLEEKNRWIPVTEQSPEVWRDKDGEAINYLAVIPGFGVDVANWIEPARCWCCLGVPCQVTHWMPMPELPKGETK